MNSSPTFRIAFVCTGNICRSPLAEALARFHAERNGFKAQISFESFGTHDYHVGEQADRRTIDVAREFGIDLSPHRARQFSAKDFGRFNLVLAMDAGHERFLRRWSAAGGSDERIKRYLPFVAPDEGVDVPDPYDGDRSGFVAVHRMLDRTALLLAGRLPELMERHRG